MLHCCRWTERVEAHRVTGATERHLAGLLDRYPVLETCRADIDAAYTLSARTFSSGCKLLVCGNGGSAADADHIVGELLKGFLKKRRPRGELARRLAAADPDLGPRLAAGLQEGLPAISLAGAPAFSTA